MKELSRPYDFFEHTADVGIQIYGRTLKELFAHGAAALFEFIADLSTVGRGVKRQVELDCFDREELFVRWLSELLYIYEAERLVLCAFDPIFVRGGRLRATVHGEPFDAERHRVFNQVKAVTYHRVQITRGNGLWVARVILDV
jgi:SHS2 domain-containing protein